MYFSVGIIPNIHYDVVSYFDKKHLSAEQKQAYGVIIF